MGCCTIISDVYNLHTTTAAADDDDDDVFNSYAELTSNSNIVTPNSSNISQESCISSQDFDLNYHLCSLIQTLSLVKRHSIIFNTMIVT